MAEAEAGVGAGSSDAGGGGHVWKAPASLYVKLSALAGILTLMVGYHYAVRGFHRYPTEDRATVPAADPRRGPELFRAHGCVGCHTIPGVPEATGKVGPRLDRVKEQSYIAGVLPNSPQHLVEWIRRPRDIDPHTAMPNLGVGPEDARDMAAYLYALP